MKINDSNGVSAALCAARVFALLGSICLLGMATAARGGPNSPDITSANNATFTVGVSNSFTVTATGTPLPTISRKGARPPSSLTFSAAPNSGAGTLAGTPLPGQGGVYTFKFRASNGDPPPANQNFTLRINEAPRFTSFNAMTCAVNQPCTFTVTTAGFPLPSIAITGGNLPSGMTFTNNGNGTATISGTPSVGVAASPLQLTATSDAGSVVQSFSITVNNLLSITSAATTTCVVGQPCSFTVTARGTNVPTEKLHISLTSGELPQGLAFTDNSECAAAPDGPCNIATATLSGTALAGGGGTYNLTFTATDGSADADAVQGFVLVVNEAPSFISLNAATCAKDANCDFEVSANGYPIPTIALTSGALPAALDGVAGTNGNFTVSGVTNPNTAGIYPLVFTASNGVSPNATQNFTLTVNNVLAITSDAATVCVVGTPCNFTVTAVGTNTASEKLHLSLTSGTLPSGMTFVDNDLCNAAPVGPCADSGSLSGIASALSGGVYTLTFTATDGSADADAVQSFTLVVNEAPTITGIDNLTCIEEKLNCSFTVSSAGFPIPTISLSGALPTGVNSQTNANGSINVFGSPNAGTAGSYPLQFVASNGIGVDASLPVALTIVTEANSATVNVELLGGGSGKVTSVPSGIDCPGSCAKVLAAGTEITLSASAIGGAVFVGWLGGGCTGDALTCTFTAVSATNISATFAPAGTVISFDIDLSGAPTQYAADSDALMIARYLFGFTENAVTQDAWVSAIGGRTESATRDYLKLITPLLDIDNNKRIDALTDGLLIVRYMLGLRGSTLVDGALGTGALRDTTAIEAYLASKMP